ncbi:YraN family protein [Arcanobacterium pinnipediorum]|uniref:UPF0102 protein NG665_02855 n=1 Tax=Arcanobacterium pinnipediorum TaxID=1503041 RepID=A0ABY5AL04_9ACTO|nr:YraN family protein [Arcanobacterium pinnipediorum]USR79934.1 YraN family protein [Arcanobacterium pinnipediorum]
MENIDDAQAIGVWGEETASRYLQSHGWTILDRNWRCASGEIDILGFDPQRDALVAVEVKTRRSQRFGIAEESITTEKLTRIRKTFTAWLYSQHRRASSMAIDVIALTCHSADDFRLRHLKGVA